jgi:hypothetical protein
MRFLGFAHVNSQRDSIRDGKEISSKRHRASAAPIKSCSKKWLARSRLAAR